MLGLVVWYNEGHQSFERAKQRLSDPNPSLRTDEGAAESVTKIDVDVDVGV